MSRPSHIKDRFDHLSAPARHSLGRRIAKEMGVQQFQEILWGYAGDDSEWQSWCEHVLDLHPDPIPLMLKLAQRCQRLADTIPSRAANYGVAEDAYWLIPEGNDAFEKGLAECIELKRVSQTDAVEVRRLREARFTRLCCLPHLTVDRRTECGAVFADLFRSGCRVECESACELLLARGNGRALLAQFARDADLEALITIGEAAISTDTEKEETHRQVVKIINAVRQRLWSLWKDPQVSSELWLSHASHLLLPPEIASVCLSLLGRHSEKLDGLATHILHLNEAASRQLILRTLSRILQLFEMDDQNPAMEGGVGAEVHQWAKQRLAWWGDHPDRLHRLFWEVLLDQERFPTALDVLQGLSVIYQQHSRAGSSFSGEGKTVVSLRRAFVQLVDLALRLCGTDCIPYLIRCLRFKEDLQVYYAAFNGLLELGAAACPALVESLAGGTSDSQGIVSLMERLQIRELPARFIELLGSEDEILKREVFRMLSLREDPAVLPFALQWAEGEDAADRAWALFAFYHLGTAEGLPCAIRCLTDPHRVLRQQARWALLRIEAPERIGRLEQAAKEGPRYQRVQVLTLLGDIGSSEAGSALEALSSIPGELGRMAGRIWRKLEKGICFDPGALPVLRNPYEPARPLPTNWKRYFTEIIDDPFLLSVFDGLAEYEFALTDDNSYTRAHKACFVEGSGDLPWLLFDIMYPTAQTLATAFVLHHKAQIADSDLDLALHSALRQVDGHFLSTEWEKGHPSYMVGHEESPEWQLAVMAVFQENLSLLRDQLQSSMPKESNPLRASAIEMDWNRLRKHSDFYWGLLVKPRFPLTELAGFCARNVRAAGGKSTTETGKTVREIIDYLVLECTFKPGTRQWRSQCREALWDCFLPLRRRIHKQYQKDVWDLIEKRPTAEEAEFEGSRIREVFEKSLRDYDPFFGGAPEPMIPIGFIELRSADGKLPKSHYGRGVPFPSFFLSRIDNKFPRRKPPSKWRFDEDRDSKTTKHSSGRAASPLGNDHLEDTTDEEKGNDAEQYGWDQRDAPLMTITDDSGVQWVTYHELTFVLGLSRKQILTAERNGWICFQYLGKRKVVPHEDLPTLKAEVEARFYLKDKKNLSKLLGVTPQTLRNWQKRSPDPSSPARTLQFLREQATKG